MVRNYKRTTAIEDQWTNQDLLKAISSVEGNELNVKEAAIKYGISKATLYRQYNRFKLNGCQPEIILEKKVGGGHSILSTAEEDVLETTLMELDQKGKNISAVLVRRICFEYCKVNGIPTRFKPEEGMAGQDWYYGYLKRHPNVKRLVMKVKDKRDTKQEAVPSPTEGSKSNDTWKLPKSKESRKKPRSEA